jgi:hypothetical protein
MVVMIFSLSKMKKIVFDMINDFQRFIRSAPYTFKVLLLTYSSLALASYIMMLLQVPDMIAVGSAFGVLLMITLRFRKSHVKVENNENYCYEISHKNSHSP